MNFLTILLWILGFFFLAILLSALYFLYCFTYPFSISSIRILNGQAHTVAVKPGLRWRKSIKFKNSVHLGSRYFAIWTGSDPSEGVFQSGGLSMFGEVYIMRRDTLGRFNSVDLNDKFIQQFLNK